MRKIIFALSLTILFAGLTMGQAGKPFDVYAGGGVTIPQDEARDDFKNGFNGLGVMAYNAMPSMKYFTKIELNSFKSESNMLLDLTQNNLLLGVGGILSPKVTGLPLKPFGIAGAGIASISFSEGSGSVSKFYYEFGAGAELGSGNFSFFIMARYITISTEIYSFKSIPITVGIRF